MKICAAFRTKTPYRRAAGFEPVAEGRRRSGFASLGNGNYNPLIASGIPLEADISIKGAQFDMRDVAFCARSERSVSGSYRYWCGVGADTVWPSGGNYAWKSAATYKSATMIVGAPTRSLGVGGMATPLAMHCYTQVPQLQFKEPRGRRLLE